MNFDISKAQENLKHEIIAFAQEHLNEGVEGRDRDQRFDRSLWKKSGEAGLLGLAIPKQYGGRGLSALDMAIALEALGYGCRDNGLSFAIGAHLTSCVLPIWKYGTEEQKEHFLPKMSNGEWVATNAITETQSGSDVFSMSTIAKKDGGSYILSGEKNYCSNAPVADVALVYAVTNGEKGAMGGVSGFLLRRGENEFSTSQKIEKMGLRSCEMGKVFLNNTRVEATSILGKEGGGTIQFTHSMTWERIVLSAIHLGTIKRLLADAVSYTKQRKVYGKSIDAFQAIGHLLADIRVQIDAAEMLIYKAAWQLAEGSKKANTSASVAKLYVSEMYKNQTSNLLHIYGAIGYINNSDIERSVRDAAASTLYSGTSEIQKNLIFRTM